jgi:uncharacterized protein YpmB
MNTNMMSKLLILLVFVISVVYFCTELNSEYHDAKKQAHAHIVYGLDIVHKECFYVEAKKHSGNKFKKRCFTVIGE